MIILIIAIFLYVIIAFYFLYHLVRDFDDLYDIRYIGISIIWPITLILGWILGHVDNYYRSRMKRKDEEQDDL